MTGDRLTVRPAGDNDIDELIELVNGAYRGNTSREGWTTEADFLDGRRTDSETLRQDMSHGEILCLRDELQLLGCVYLEKISSETTYLGMLTVRPAQQDRGFGRTLLAQAEEHARRQGARRITLGVIQLRESLIAWYERRGYRRTGEIKDFPYGDERFGAPKRDDLHFVLFEKELQTSWLEG
jgi:ribosomal protein S18 acetylase RimI-like enzyme